MHMNLTALAFVCALLASAAAGDELSFEAFASKFSKNYATSQERAMRQSIYAATVRQVEKHNTDPARTYTMGITEFADRTEDEFAQLLGAIPPADAAPPPGADPGA